MKLRLEDKRRAISLRVQGKSYGEIISIIPDLPKSTLSGWLKNIKLTENQEKRLEKNIEKITTNARIKSAYIRRQKNIEKTKTIFEEAKKELPTLMKNPLFLIGLSLYWAEGSKTNGYIQVCNSDPQLIKIMLKWFKEICKIPKDRIKIRIYIHEIYKNENCEKFWSNIANIPVCKFKKTVYKPTPHKLKKNLDYKGVCRLETSNINLFKKIIGWQRGIQELI